MARFEYNPQADRQQEPRKQLGLGDCEVIGCPRNGHIRTESWNCRYHHRKAGKDLGRITHNLLKYQADIDWYEKLLQFTVVDYEMGDVTYRAPVNLRPKDREKWLDYKARMKQHIDSILKS